MLRFIVAGDIHFRGSNPRARLDNYPEALTDKIEEVFDIADAHFCAGIIVPGDICDTPGLGLATIGDLMDLLSDTPCPIYTVPGNHDEWGHSPDALRRTPYGLLNRLGIIHNLSAEIHEISQVVLTGHGWDTDTDRGGIEQYLSPVPVADARPGAIRIHVAHGMLLDTLPSYDMARYTLVTDVAQHPNAPDVLIVGHEHIGFGIKRIGHTLFINPGALCRLSAHPAEMERTIQVCLLTITDGGEVIAELIPLKSARPGYKVLSREHLEAQAARDQLLDDFMSKLAEEGEGRYLQVQDIIDDIARREMIPEEVVQEALRRINQAREKVGT